jgi:hypothetical protein
MVLYITKENQEMLWTLIHKTPQINTYFENKPVSEKTEWFKYVIQTFYAKHKFRELSVPELQQVNKDTLTYMLHYVRPVSYGMQPGASEAAWPKSGASEAAWPKSGAMQTQPVFSRSQIGMNSGNTMESQFQVRQQEYTQMLDKPIPDSVNFREKVEDQAISNMEELIEMHRRQREKELAEFAPPPLQPQDNPITNQPLQNTPVIEPQVSTETNANVENIRFNVEDKPDVLEEKIRSLEYMVLELKAEVLSLRNDLSQNKDK